VNKSKAVGVDINRSPNFLVYIVIVIYERNISSRSSTDFEFKLFNCDALLSSYSQKKSTTGSKKKKKKEYKRCVCRGPQMYQRVSIDDWISPSNQMETRHERITNPSIALSGNHHTQRRGNIQMSIAGTALCIQTNNNEKRRRRSRTNFQLDSTSNSSHQHIEIKVKDQVWCTV
jgi:hypothetical protein